VLKELAWRGQNVTNVVVHTRTIGVCLKSHQLNAVFSSQPKNRTLVRQLKLFFYSGTKKNLFTCIEDDACEIPSTNTCELYTGVKGLCVKKSECNIESNPEGFCEDSKSNVCCIDRGITNKFQIQPIQLDLGHILPIDQVNPCAHSKSEYLPHAIKTKFIHCSNNMQFTKDCGAGTVWSQIKINCVEQNYFEKFLSLIGVDFDFNIDFDEKTTEKLTTQNTCKLNKT
jgi:hypothetical protein